MSRKQKVITSVEAKEVSLVDAGANLKPRFSVTKSKKEPNMTIDMNELANLAVDGEASVVKEGLSEESQNFAKSLYRICANGADLLPKEVVDAIAKDFGTPPVEDVSKAAQDNELVVELAKAKETIAKAHEDLSKAQGDLAQATTKISEMEKAADLASWTSRVEKSLVNYPGKSLPELVTKFQKLAALDKELAEESFSEAELVAKAITDGGLLKTIGHTTDADPLDEPLDRLSKMATEVQKSNTELTYEQAYARVVGSDVGRELAQAAFGKGE